VAFYWLCGQSPEGLAVVESHFSQRTREMGHPPVSVARAPSSRPSTRLK